MWWPDALSIFGFYSIKNCELLSKRTSLPSAAEQHFTPSGFSNFRCGKQAIHSRFQGQSFATALEYTTIISASCTCSMRSSRGNNFWLFGDAANWRAGVSRHAISTVVSFLYYPPHRNYIRALPSAAMRICITLPSLLIFVPCPTFLPCCLHQLWRKIL